jgi:hypothetical protein
LAEGCVLLFRFAVTIVLFLTAVMPKPKGHYDHATNICSGGNSGHKNGGSHGNGGARSSSGGGYRKFAAVATAAAASATAAFYADQQNQHKKYVLHLTTSLICLSQMHRKGQRKCSTLKPVQIFVSLKKFRIL